MLPITFIIVVFERWVHYWLYLTTCVYYLVTKHESLAILKVGKGGKRLQIANHETVLQDLEDVLQEIDKLEKQNNSMMGKVAELRSQDNELYHEFVDFTRQSINTLEERSTSLNQWVKDLFKIQDQKEKLIESLQQ